MIDLEKYSPQTIVLSGRPKGEKIRTDLKLDIQDSLPQTIIVKVPDRVVSINSSFFLGLFGKSVRALGSKNFKAKYEFSARPQVIQDIERGIQDALESSNPLTS